jgi:hypothetical protein
MSPGTKGLSTKTTKNSLPTVEVGLTGLRLRRIADVQKQRLRQPTTFLPNPLFS